MMAIKVAKLKEVYRVNKLPLGGKKKELQDSYKVKLNDRVELILKATE